MGSPFHIGMPGVYLLHNVRHNLFQTVTLYITEGSSSWLYSTDLGQGPLQERDLRGERKKHWGQGRHWAGGMTKTGGIRWDHLFHTEQPDPQAHLGQYFPEMAHQRGFLFLYFPSVPLLPISMLSQLIYFPWPLLGNKARGRNNDPQPGEKAAVLEEEAEIGRGNQNESRVYSRRKGKWPMSTTKEVPGWYGGDEKVSEKGTWVTDNLYKHRQSNSPSALQELGIGVPCSQHLNLVMTTQDCIVEWGLSYWGPLPRTREAMGCLWQIFTAFMVKKPESWPQPHLLTINNSLYGF